MNEIKCYFEPTDSYAKIEIMEHIEATSNKRPIEINSINELTHVKDGQKNNSFFKQNITYCKMLM
jgi:hypothetical protein